jgi:hypothetical protein
VSDRKASTVVHSNECSRMLIIMRDVLIAIQINNIYFSFSIFIFIGSSKDTQKSSVCSIFSTYIYLIYHTQVK